MIDMIRVLLVEDSPDIQVIVRMTLEATNRYAVAIASSGEEALRQAADERPDVVLLDVMMPGMDGLETLRQLRADPSHSGLPVIFMTAKVLEHEMHVYRALGALGVIGKPFDPLILPGRIRELLESRHAAPPPALATAS